MFEVISGIYIIKNQKNGKVYIGSSKDIDKRWVEHKRTLNKNKHHNFHLQKAWNKYGGNNFIFEILEIVHNEEKLIEREQFWMDAYKCYDSEDGYNINPTAGSQLGRKNSKETKLKMMKSNHLTLEIVQIDTQGNFVNEFPSINQAVKETKISNTSILKSLKNKTFFKGYAFVYKNDYELGDFKNQYTFFPKTEYKNSNKPNINYEKIIGKIESVGNGILISKTKFQELISITPKKLKQNYRILELSFLNYNDCEIIVNDEVLFLPAGKGFFANEKSEYTPITSFIIVQSGTIFHLEGTYSIIKNI